MSASLWLDRSANALCRDDGHVFDLRQRTWVAASAGIATSKSREPITPVDAVSWLGREGQRPFRVPIGVIGPRAATDVQLGLAEQVGAGLARMSLVVLCGGREGVMAAVCRGTRTHGGLAIALTPDTDPSLANPDAGVVIATGIGEARNALIARASLCLVAIGDSFGTLSEVALGRHFGKRVFGLAGAADVAGVVHLDDAAQALTAVAETVLGLQ